MKRTQQRVGNIHSKAMTDNSLKLRTALIILAVIASAMAVLFVIHDETDSSSAEVTESGWCGPDARYYIYSDGTLEINGAGAMYDYVGVRAPWYGYRDDITKIVIDDGVTQLGQWAFAKCKHVTELTIPITLNSVVSDMYSAFAGCYNIEKINFTCGTDGYGCGYAVHEGDNPWYQLTPWYQSRDVLKEINFADGVKGIGSDAFRELNITSLVLPDTVVILGGHCFFCCTELIDLTIPISLNSYGNEDYPAFWGCEAIENVTFTRGNGVPFDYNSCSTPVHQNLAPWNLDGGVAKKIVISDDVTYLGKFMFAGCDIRELTVPITALEMVSGRHPFTDQYNDLEKIVITKGTTGVGGDYNDTFSEYHLIWNLTGCLKTLIVEEGVTHLGDYMFFGTHVEKMVLPDSLVSLGEYTFRGIKVNDLTLPISLNTVWLEYHTAFRYVAGLEKVTFTPGSGYGFNYSAYKGNNSWYQYTPWYMCRNTLKEIVFEDGIKSIGSDAFRELNLTSLVIPDSVVSLGCHTFYNCGKLTALTLPITLDSVHSAEYPAFDGCHGIITLRLTAGTDGVGADYTDCVPAWCTPLHRASEIHLDSGITYIGTDTFEGYIFFGPDGEYLEPTAANLSGHVITGDGGRMHVTDGLGMKSVKEMGPAVMSDSIPAGRF